MHKATGEDSPAPYRGGRDEQAIQREVARAAPKMLISLSSSSVGRVRRCARNSMVQPAGTSTLRSSVPTLRIRFAVRDLDCDRAVQRKLALSQNRARLAASCNAARGCIGKRKDEALILNQKAAPRAYSPPPMSALKP